MFVTRGVLTGRGFGRSTSQDSMRAHIISGQTGKLEPGVSAPMMKVVAQLWCHECTRNFGDRLVSDEGQLEGDVLASWLSGGHGKDF